jgi:hypothetical protein
MARRGEAIYLRRNTWWLDFTHEGQRHQVRLGKSISRTVAGELAVASAPGSCGVPRPSLADYVMETGAPREATAAGGG